MRKTMLLIIITAVLFSAVACKSNPPENKPAGPPEKTATVQTKKIVTLDGPQTFDEHALNASLTYIKSRFSNFHYTEAIIWMFALRYAGKAGDTALRDEIVGMYNLDDRYRIILQNKNHVDFSIFGIIPLEIYRQTGKEEFLTVGLEFADRQWDNPRADGLSAQSRFWIDDMYMLTILQLQAFRASGDPVYLEHAALEMAVYLQKLQQPNGLFYHAPDTPFYWGRGNGWVAGGMTELLLDLDPDSEHYPLVIAAYRKMMSTLLEYQDDQGVWHQLIDHPESYREGSCSAMFAYAMITGVREGWLDGDGFDSAAEKAWRGIRQLTSEYGCLQDVCVGTGKKNDLQYYLDRPRNPGDPHGQAALLWVIDAVGREIPD
ncbi:MAG: glycoside hydrolase family 88 protein [Spirochaetales bacterium]|nr:glycoside hydrolase family 88 protein [Spirochaetales bacterium]